MTTKAKGITLPSYTWVDVDEVNKYIKIYFNSTKTGNSTALGPNGIAILPGTQAAAASPVIVRINSQNASSTYNAPGADIELTTGVGSGGNASGNVKLQNSSGNGGAWNTTHLVMGIYHLWVDSSNRLRIKNSTPTSDTDGTVVGTQT